jgi:hypothetical protein
MTSPPNLELLPTANRALTLTGLCVLIMEYPINISAFGDNQAAFCSQRHETIDWKHHFYQTEQSYDQHFARQ